MITCRDNPTVRKVKRLLHDAKYRRKTGLFALEGARLCRDAAGTVPLRTALATERAQKIYGDAVRSLEENGARVLSVSEEVASFIGDTATTQGIFCIAVGIDKPAGLDTIKNDGMYLAAERMQNPSNLGAIIRTAEALGMDGLLISDGCCDRYNPKVLRACMGGSFRFPVVETGEMSRALRILRERGMTPFACVVDADAQSVRQVSFPPGSIAVIGNEGAGVSRETREVCSRRITVRMTGRTESLNAAVAAALVMWEMKREPREEED